jgi:hypothetical protein
MDIFFVIGVVGMILILLAFLLNQISVWKQNTLLYDSCNALGGFLLVVYAFDGKAWPFVILNGVWTLYSVKDVLVTLVHKK